MRVITDLWVQGYVGYKKAHLKIDAPLIIIRGLNKDRIDPKSSNAVGKSTLPSAIPTLMFSAPPMATGKNEAGSLFSKEGYVRLRIKDGDVKHDIKQWAKGKGVAYTIKEDGVDLGIRKIKDCQAQIRKILPITDDQFYTMNYLSPRDYHVLLQGKSDARFDFFEDLFGLGVYDRIFAAVSKEYNALKAKRQNLEFLTTERQSVKPAKSIDLLRSKLTKLEYGMNKVQKRIASYRDEQQHISAFISLSDGLDIETSMEVLLSKVIVLKAKQNKTQSDYDTTLRDEQAYKSYKKAATLMVETQAEIAKISAPVHKLIEINAFIEDSYARMIAIEQALSSAESKAESAIKLGIRIDAMNIKPKLAEKASQYTVKQLQAASTKTAHEMKRNATIFKNLPVDLGSKCPTCGQSINYKETARLRLELTADNKKLIDRLTNYSKIKDYLELTEELIAIGPIEEIDGLRLKLAKTQKEWYKYKEALYNYQTRKVMVARYKDLKTTNKAVNKPSVPATEIAKDLEATIAAIDETRQTVATRKKLSAMRNYDSTEEARLLHAKYNRFIIRYQPRLDKALSAFQKLSVAISNGEQTKTKLAELDERITVLTNATEDFAIYEALREAYGAKGLRIIQIKNLADLYCERLNRYAHLMYPEPIKFTVIVAKSQFSILATRSGKTSDVRRLSGSEKTSFVLLSLIALLPYIPANKRLNLLVIDEVETGMDSVVLHKFIHDLLPVLKTIIPNIILITPLNRAQFSVPDAKELLVVKENNISTIGEA